jgi:hypothetical protein
VSDGLGSSDKLLISLNNIYVMFSQSDLDAAVGKRWHIRGYLSISKTLPGFHAPCSWVTLEPCDGAHGNTIRTAYRYCVSGGMSARPFCLISRRCGGDE